MTSARTPQTSESRRATSAAGVTATMRRSGRWRATANAVAPDWVTGTMAASRRSDARSHTAALTASWTSDVAACASDPFGRDGLLGGLRDASHRLDDEHGMVPHRRLAGEHDRVRAVEDRVRDVACLGARRTRRVRHRVEHLRRDHDRLARHARGGDDALGDHGNLLGRRFDGQVTAGDHDRVRCREDLVERGHGLVLLDLGDDGDAPRHERAQVLDVCGASARTTGR